MSYNVGRVLTDVADALLFGIPSSILLDDIRNQYDIDYADAINAIDRVQEAINAQDISIENLQKDKEYLQENKDRIASQLFTYSPLSEFRATLSRKYDDLTNKQYDINSKISKASDQIRQLNTEMASEQNKANQAMINKSKSLGTEAVERI